MNNEKILENETNISEIIKKGDSNLPFESNEEIEIYLKHLIANKEAYINHASKYERFDKTEDLNLIFWEITTGIVSGMITAGAIFIGLMGFIVGDIPSTITALQVMGIFDIPTAIFLITSKIVRHRNAIKIVENKIKDLENALSFDANKNLDKSLEELKTMIEKSISSTRTYSQDAYIANIEKDMEIVASLKYIGYENDLFRLCSLAEKYINTKNKMETINASDVLSTNDWFKPLIEIEAKFGNTSKIQEDQIDIKEALKRMKELLIRESIITTEQEESQTEDNGYQPTLKL